MNFIAVRAASENGTQTDFAYDQDFVIGRVGKQVIVTGRSGEPTHALPADDYISPRHARFICQDGQWLVEDMGSTNGTWVNGARCYAPVPLAKGDQVRVGRTVLTVVPA